MTSIGLFFVGAVLFINGLTLLGRVTPGGAAPINAFVGSLLIVVTAFIALPLRDVDLAENRELLVGSAGFLLFAFTYLWVALNNWTGEEGSGLGWYCLWAAGISAFLAVLNLADYGNVPVGMLWVLWTVLFLFFFVVLALEMEELTAVTGWVTVTEAFVTATVPGALLLLGEWDDLADGVAIGVAVATIAVFGILTVRALGQRRRPQGDRALGASVAR